MRLFNVTIVLLSEGVFGKRRILIFGYCKTLHICPGSSARVCCSRVYSNVSRFLSRVCCSRVYSNVSRVLSRVSCYRVYWVYSNVSRVSSRVCCCVPSRVCFSRVYVLQCVDGLNRTFIVSYKFDR